MAALVFLGLLWTAAGEARAAPRLKHRLYIAPDEIRTLDTRTLAELLVRRIHEECDLAGAAAPEGKPVGDDAELIMMIPQNVIGSIVTYGFLNQHNARTSHGVYTVSARFAAERELAMSRLPYSHKGKELLPKYALLLVKRDDFGTFPLPSRYGPVAVVFKDEVMKRATWTYADSSDFHFKAGRFSRGGAGNPVLTHTALYRRKPEDKNKCGNYCEAQIWGRLSLEDVDHLMIRDAEPVTAALLNSGLRVYRYSTAPGVPYIRGELLSEGRAGAPSAPEEASSPAAANHLKDRERASLSEEALLARNEGSASDIGELAARPKSAGIVRELTTASSSKDPELRASALYGLSELPWKEFRAFLVAGLKDKSALVNTEAVAFASEHRDDAEIAGLLKDLKNRPERDLLETVDWLERSSKPRFCE